MNFGKRLKQEREKNNLSKVDLAAKVGVHYSQLGRYERDEASPSAEMLKKIANELGITTDYLMNGARSEMAQEKIKDKKLINQFNRIADLNDLDKNIVVRLIDAFLFQQEMKIKLAM